MYLSRHQFLFSWHRHRSPFSWPSRRPASLRFFCDAISPCESLHLLLRRVCGLDSCFAEVLSRVSSSLLTRSAYSFVVFLCGFSRLLSNLHSNFCTALTSKFQLEWSKCFVFLCFSNHMCKKVLHFLCSNSDEIRRKFAIYF